MARKNVDWPPHLDREHVYRVPDFQMPDVIDTIVGFAPSVVYDGDEIDLDRRACERCKKVTRVPTHWDPESKGHCSGCGRLTRSYPIA